MASTDREALLALLRSAGGANWEQNENWGTDADLSQWQGVEVNEQGRVVKVQLESNNLQGPIPKELRALSKLERLELYRNELTGHIPPHLGDLRALKSLDLRYNGLDGHIPPQLGDLGALKHLYLSHNKLDGHIPPQLGDLGALEYIHLSHSKVDGHIPPELGALGELRYVRLSSNELTGSIPPELGKIAALVILDLSGNQLSGHIPPQLGDLSALESLDLRWNKLDGTVPLGVWKLPHIAGLHIEGNLLTRFADPDEKTTSTSAVLDCMERLEGKNGNGEGLYTDGNPWEFPPAAVVTKGLESVRKFYTTWEQCNFSLEEVHALKLVFVGAYGAGKTSLARSIRKGRGDRTPETDEHRRTTVGVDLYNHRLRNGTECKIYDVAGQITYYGLHQFFLTERAVYVIVWDATRFEGLSQEGLDKAIEGNIMDWVSLLHMRTPLCTVMLVASHYDLLRGAPHEKKKLLQDVESRFLELHKEWKSLRQRQTSSMDGRMEILPGVFPVGCKLETESASCTSEDGLEAVEEALSNQASVASLIPPSWVAARQTLEQVGSAHDGSGSRRPWELRSVLHDKFMDYVHEGRSNVSQGSHNEHLADWVSSLQDDGIHDSMEGAVELRAFSGTVISQDTFVVLDVRWLAGVLKPILDHRGVTPNRIGQQVFANRVLDSTNLLYWARELVAKGVLRKGFARFLWNLDSQGTGELDEPQKMEPSKFEEILEEVGIAIPLPVPSLATSAGESENSNGPATREAGRPADGVDHGKDLLVIMRLPQEADAKMRETLSSVREPDLSSGETGAGKATVKAVFEFDNAGAPHGLPERVMALTHQIGTFSPRARWRYGGLFILRNKDTTGGASSMMVLEYDKKHKTFSIEALGRTTPHIQAVQFVISALFHVARDFPGANWTGWIECGMNHPGEKMYYLAPAGEKESHRPGSSIVPRMKSSSWDQDSKQQNMCTMEGVERRGSCTVDPDVFGQVLDVKQTGTVDGPSPDPNAPSPPQDTHGTEDARAPSSADNPSSPSQDVRGTVAVDGLLPDQNTPSPPRSARGGEDANDPSLDEKTPSWCREVHDYVLKPLSGKIFSSSLAFSVGFFVAATAIDDAKRVTLNVCFGLAGLCLLVALIAACAFCREKIDEGRNRGQERAGADQNDGSSFIP